MKRLALLLVSCLLADAALYFGLRRLDSSRLFYDRSNISQHQLDYWLATSYDPELGWDVPADSKNNLGAARRPDYPPAQRYKIKAFGDSFVFGSDVADSDAWPAQVERYKDWTCLNFGVPGYGPDQALLKYRRTAVPTEVTILGIQQENIGRLVNIYRAFYMGPWGPTKPRFFLDGGGLRLHSNPIPRPEDAGRLLDPAFVDSLRRLDYWPAYNEQVLGAPRRLSWPASWLVLRHAPFLLDRAWIETHSRLRPAWHYELRRFRPYHLYDESSEAFQILIRVIDEFTRLCAGRGERPLVLFFPLRHTVEMMRTYNRCVYEPLQRRLRDRDIPHIDFGPIFAREDFPRYYNPAEGSGHFTVAGNERVAREVIHYLAR